jgi:hypothetical protein
MAFADLGKLAETLRIGLPAGRGRQLAKTAPIAIGCCQTFGASIGSDPADLKAS